MASFTVMDRCTGIDMPDGTKYRSRRGHVDVDNPRHARQIKESFERGKGFLEDRRTIFQGATGKTCACGFVGFDWQDACLRWGGTEWEMN